MELARRVRPVLESLANREDAENYQSELNTLLARIGGRMRSLASQAAGVKENVVTSTGRVNRQRIVRSFRPKP